ncbi:maleylacetate reductase [Actinoalloteichus hymeniacidonis]|uniref:Alcohol dehydrogenase, class IV n=1 Tax=Actinoalloteichus hymeniacidonis TaxID=340345 RepID=A0AAC9HQL2_9PSEU|nr:maleylacetate reductase [Actinoalloteichus hymeniacidonis]AOS63564.1 alcohol dehydrogenase, class IV [Actinoalloteichus hymeniacidonis]MBB5908390.1 alcohol dehydrogenase class IV [Actinoalloteichus hymeniacidonis]
MRTFVHESSPGRVVFGADVVDRVGDEVRRLGGNRPLVVSGPSRRSVDRVRRGLDPLAVGEFAGAAMHAPVEVTEQALTELRRHRADCVVSIGGGSATGLSKALAARTDLPQVVIPTTYSGSEVTSVLGETSQGRKTTRSSPMLLPETVLYDVNLTLGLPVAASVTSAVNAMAHAVEALYSPQANGLVDAVALAAIRMIGPGLSGIRVDPRDTECRAALLEAAWLAGMTLASAGMGLHHKLCHVLGGSFGLAHAPTHTVVLPHVLAYNSPAIGRTTARIADALGVGDAAVGLAHTIRDLGGPVSLRALGLREADLPEVARRAVAAPYANPRPVEQAPLEALLRIAWEGGDPRTP